MPDMPDATEPVMEDAKVDRCPRCLQPVPPRASRCPGCGQPMRSARSLTFTIGIAGPLVLLLAMFVMYQLVANEDAANAPVPVEVNAAPQEQLLPDPPPASHPTEPAKPEKKPPLDER